jgi:hypothetical protein
MSHVAQPKLQTTGQLRKHRLVALAALLALVATVGVVLVLAIADHPSTSSVADLPQQVMRADGGPQESSVAAAIGSQPPVIRPDESRIAAAIGSAREPAPAPARRTRPGSPARSPAASRTRPKFGWEATNRWA